MAKEEIYTISGAVKARKRRGLGSASDADIARYKKSAEHEARLVIKLASSGDCTNAMVNAFHMQHSAGSYYASEGRRDLQEITRPAQAAFLKHCVIKR
jgi:hypothetical protein